MSGQRFHGRQQLEQAEGYLDLVTIAASKLGVDGRLRRRFAVAALRTASAASVTSSDAWRRDLIVGQAWRVLSHHRRAAVPLLRVTRCQPAKPEAWIALGWCLKRMKRLDQAAAVLARGIWHLPDHAPLHYNLACYLGLLGQADNAVAELIWALDLEPRLKRRIERESDFDMIRLEPAFQAISQLAA